jgi:hypothetical protein
MNDSGCVFIYPIDVLSGPEMILDITTAAWEEAAYIDLTVYGGIPPYSFYWNTGDTIEDIYVQENGDYIVVVSDQNGCGETDTANITRVSIDDLLKDPGYAIFPNPCSDLLEIDLADSKLVIDRLIITDGTGRMVREVVWDRMTDNRILNISDLAEGSYRLTLEGPGISSTIPLVKVTDP